MPIYAYAPDGVTPVCGRIAKSGQPCQSKILNRENGRCGAKGHGGKSTGRPIVHGHRSKVLASIGLGEKAQAILSDSELKSHRDNILLYEIALQTTIEQGLPTEADWKDAIALYRQAIDEQNKSALLDLGKKLESGLESAKRLTTALNLADKQRLHIESEAKREADLQTNLNARQANALVAALVAAVQEEEEITDAIRRRIQTRLVRLLSR